MKGIGVSPGIVIGRAHLMRKAVFTTSGSHLKGQDEIESELQKFDLAVERSVLEMKLISQSESLSLKEEELEILETQVELLTDPQIRSNVSDKISAELKNVNDALIEVIAELVELFKNMDDPYMSARSADIQDIGERLLRQLNTSHEESSGELGKDTILIAEDISPSDTLTMNLELISGFATAAGGKTSHAAIVAKSRGIPAVLGCGNDIVQIKENDLLILDGSEGIVHVNPDSVLLAGYEEKAKLFRETSILLDMLKERPCETADGKRISLSANISGPEDMDAVFERGGDGVGLFRTELLFMGRTSIPSEEEQFEFYKKVASKSSGKPVVIRTLDIGGDKELPYFNLEKEENPFLGYRAIRICLDRPDLFMPQLRAILRASVFGDFRIMFPMISNIQEIKKAKLLLEKAKKELMEERLAFNEHIQIGIMIEIPSAAVMADLLAKEVDFFSIGTNDLCQYTLAVDRMNEKIKELYDPFNPGVLRLIKNVIEAGKKQNIHVGMCGEFASDTLATLLLLGLGLEDFSMSAVSIPSVKNIILKTSSSKAAEIASRVMDMDNSEDICLYLKKISL